MTENFILLYDEYYLKINQPSGRNCEKKIKKQNFKTQKINQQKNYIH